MEKADVLRAEKRRQRQLDGQRPAVVDAGQRQGRGRHLLLDKAEVLPGFGERQRIRMAVQLHAYLQRHRNARKRAAAYEVSGFRRRMYADADSGAKRADNIGKCMHIILSLFLFIISESASVLLVSV